MECIKLNLLCKYMEKVRGSQFCVSISPCTELSKTEFFPARIVIAVFIFDLINIFLMYWDVLMSPSKSAT